MAEQDVLADPGPVEGESPPAPAPATDTAPTTTHEGGTEDSFFDPKELPPELMPAYKQMQRAWTKKTQELAKHRQKVEAYDQFMVDPVTNLQQLARQYGLEISRAEAKQIAKQQEEWQPQTWTDVITKAKAEAKQELLSELGPLIGEVRGMKRSQIERDLDEHVPEWRAYESEMASAIRKHPTLVNEPELLARMVIPQEVLEGRAYQAALKKLQAKAEASRVSSGSQTSRSADAETPNKAMSFDEAVAYARQKLAKQGMRPPSG